MTSENKIHCSAVKFIIKCSSKLKLNATTLASACVLYHRFFKHCIIENYDPYTIASTAIYLATKVEEQHTRLQDIVNVCHRTMHPHKPRLELGKEFWNIRDTITSGELVMLRVLQFQVTCTHPHKYLLHYLMSLSQLFHSRDWSRKPISDTAWAILKDSYLSKTCLNHTPQIFAIAVIDLALKCCETEVPLSRHSENAWWKVLYEPCLLNDIDKVQSDIADMYALANAD